MASPDGELKLDIPDGAGEIQALALDLADMIERYPGLLPSPPVSAGRLRAWTDALGATIVDRVVVELEVAQHRAAVEAALGHLKIGVTANLRFLERQCRAHRPGRERPVGKGVGL